MRRQFILRTAAGGEGGGGTPPAATNPPAAAAAANPPTSAETGAQGKTAREVALEKKISTLEDEQNTIKGQLKEATDYIKKQVEAKPAAGGEKKENLLDEVNTFLGWGQD